jgi:hypothetical protein
MHLFDRMFQAVLPMGALALLGTVTAVGWFTQPDRYVIGYSPSQPIPFSHQEMTKIFNSGGTLAWKRVYSLPDYVFFDHRPHVNASIACQSCHGEVQTMTVLSREMSLRMSNCLACHRDPHQALPKDSPIKNGAENCSACHR